MKNIREMLTYFTSSLVLLISPGAQAAVLDNPQPESLQSGVTAIVGWICDAEQVVVVFEGFGTLEAAYGTSRADTVPACGDDDNGFGLLFNWNLLGDGERTIRILADGVEFASATVMITTLGEEFATGLSGSVTVEDFPATGQNAELVWVESLQNFVLANVFDKEAVELIENSVPDLTTVTAFTVPADRRLIITDVVISNPNPTVSSSQRIFRNGSAATAFFTVGAESAFEHTFATGLEFGPEDEVRVRNGASAGNTHFYLRGYLTNP